VVGLTWDATRASTTATEEDASINYNNNDKQQQQKSTVVRSIDKEKEHLKEDFPKNNS
jgi:hypothetical protein